MYRWLYTIIKQFLFSNSKYGGYSWEFLVGVCRPVLQSWPKKNGQNLYPFSDKNRKNRTLWCSTYLYGLYKAVPPPGSIYESSFPSLFFCIWLIQCLHFSNQTRCTFSFQININAAFQDQWNPNFKIIFKAKWPDTHLIIPYHWNRKGSKRDDITSCCIRCFFFCLYNHWYLASSLFEFPQLQTWIGHKDSYVLPPLGELAAHCFSLGLGRYIMHGRKPTGIQRKSLTNKQLKEIAFKFFEFPQAIF